MKHWYVYMMTNKPNGVIYIGSTDNLEEMSPSWNDLSLNWNLNFNKLRNE